MRANIDSEEFDTMGAELESLPQTPHCSAELPDLKSAASDQHTILVLAESVSDAAPPRPFPEKPVDPTYGWSEDRIYVRMPCSSENLFSQGDSSSDQQWPRIISALSSCDSWQTSHDIEKAIRFFNPQLSSFDILHHFFDEHLDKTIAERYMIKVVPAIARLVLRLPELITQPLPFLRQGKSSSVTMSQEQAACILGNAFFCTFPGRNEASSLLPSMNFNSLYEDFNPCVLQKLQCYFHYFERVAESMPCGLLTFSRRALDVFPNWASSRKQLRRLHISATGTIEDDGQGMLQLDFANESIGGIVCGHGCTQEEIRFIINPELNVACLLGEVMIDNDCLIMKGVERFSRYTGYLSTFQWTGDHRDDVPRDAWMRRETEVLGLDATPFIVRSKQFTDESLTRELNKAFIGFHGDGQPVEHLSAIATGNWGCGCFGGDKELKSLLQLMAAAETGRDLAYFTFGDRWFVQELHRVHQQLAAAKCDVGRLRGLIGEYAKIVLQQPTRARSMSLFDFVLKAMADQE